MTKTHNVVLIKQARTKVWIISKQQEASLNTETFADISTDTFDKNRYAKPDCNNRI